MRLRSSSRNQPRQELPSCRRPSPAPAAFVAQQMGQSGQKRGLRGGPPVLDAARSAYLGAEYSGAAERRPKTGKTAKTDI